MDPTSPPVDPTPRAEAAAAPTPAAAAHSSGEGDFESAGLLAKLMVVFVLVVVCWGTVLATELRLDLHAALRDAGIPKAELRPIVNQFTITSTGATFVGTLIVLIVVYYFSRFVTAPVSELTEGVRRVAAGDLRIEVSVDEGADDEFAELAVSFNSMVRELQTLAGQAYSIANCDLSLTVDGEGELATAFRSMLLGQRELVREVNELTADLDVASQEILATLRAQEENTHDHAGAIEETRRTTEALLESSSQIAELAQQVHTNALKTKSSNETIVQRASELDRLTVKIGMILTVLTELSDKSDVLALNAALEGTRAKEAGRGFVLLANEMRRLAERAMGSVREIQGMLESIRDASSAAVAATQVGLDLAGDAASSAEVIRLSTQQQRAGTKQVSESMDHASSLITQTVAGASEVTAAMRDLSLRSTRLRDLISRYRIEAEPAGAEPA